MTSTQLDTLVVAFAWLSGFYCGAYGWMGPWTRVLLSGAMLACAATLVLVEEKTE